MKYAITLLISSYILFTPFVSAHEYSFGEKIDLLFEVIPGSSKKQLETELKAYVHELKAYSDLSPVKQIKKIHTLTKKKYLQNYSLYAFFPELESKGIYNCVTGSALFAIIFDELNIPYSIVEVPHHVYVLAYPENQRIAVESTVDKQGVYNWTVNTKLDALTYLLNNTSLTQEEIELKGADAIIEEYFYTNADLDFSGLAGIHFLNRAIYLADKKRYDEALHCVDRANELYNSQALQFIEGSILINLLEDGNLEALDEVYYYLRYYRVCQTRKEKERIHGNVTLIIDNAINDRRDFEFIDSAEHMINDLLDSTSAKLFYSTIEEVKSIWHFNRGSLNKALASAEKAYELTPDRKNLEDIIAACIMASISELEYDPDKLEIAFKNYLIKYPFLKDQPRFQNYFVVYNAVMAAEYFLENEEKIALNYLAEMESYLDSEDLDMEECSFYIADAYGEYALYLYRQKSYQEAMKWIDLALELDPGNSSFEFQKSVIQSKL